MGRIEEKIAENFMERKNVYADEICTVYFNDRMAVLGMRLLKGKGRSYERIRNDDRIREKEQFCPFSRNESPVSYTGHYS